jgi:hypothetical protein
MDFALKSSLFQNWFSCLPSFESAAIAASGIDYASNARHGVAERVEHSNNPIEILKAKSQMGAAYRSVVCPTLTGPILNASAWYER